MKERISRVCWEISKKNFVNAIQKAGLIKIYDYNNSVIAALFGMRKAVSRPLRSLRYKAMSRVSCKKCEVAFINNNQHSVHKKMICH